MRATLFDARVGAARPLEGRRPPALGWKEEAVGAEGSLARARGRLLAGSLAAALRALGYEPRPGGEPELCFGERACGEALWVRPGPGPAEAAAAAAARGFSEADLRQWALRRPYREAAALSWPDLEAAREERAALAAALRGLVERRAPSAPNAAGLAGYRKLFREALARDFDAPAALSSLWDALRPGALSPGSQLAVLREADAALGLGLEPSQPGS